MEVGSVFFVWLLQVRHEIFILLTVRVHCHAVNKSGDSIHRITNNCIQHFISLVFLFLHVSARILHLQGTCVYLLSYLYNCVCRG
jgi:hypothetical protein